jgi:hypothetical protein
MWSFNVQQGNCGWVELEGQRDVFRIGGDVGIHKNRPHVLKGHQTFWDHEMIGRIAQ